MSFVKMTKLQLGGNEMSDYIAKEQPEQKRLRYEEWRRLMAERANAAMLERLQREQRVARIDKQLSELHEMAASTDHPKLKAMLSSALTKLGTVRERIAP
jgi:hypothetical protein